MTWKSWANLLDGKFGLNFWKFPVANGAAFSKIPEKMTTWRCISKSSEISL